LDGRLDENLVMASRKGDKSAYAQLIRGHYDHVFMICLGILGNVEDARVAANTNRRSKMRIAF
jgi:hypothetical protein